MGKKYPISPTPGFQFSQRFLVNPFDYSIRWKQTERKELEPISLRLSRSDRKGNLAKITS